MYNVKVGKVVEDPVSKSNENLANKVPEHSYDMPAEQLENTDAEVDKTQQGSTSTGNVDSCPQKKAKLSSDLKITGDPDELSTSPDLHHKVPAGSR